MDKTVVVKHLPLNGGDGGERQGTSVTTCHLLDHCRHLTLMDAWAYGAVGGQVHLRTEVYRLFNEPYLLLVLMVTLTDDGLDEWHRCQRRLRLRFHAEQFPQPHAVVTTIGRQEVNGLSLRACLI